MKKVGLIIQGPLVSFGKSGRTAARKLDMSSGTGEDGLVRHDCRATIRRVVEDFGSLFDAVVISTWDTEVQPSDRWAGATLVAAPDPGASMNASPLAYKAHNRNRQFVGIQHGLTWLKEHADVAYIVCMRTDQYLDLRALLDSFARRLQGESQAAEIICVPYSRPGAFLVSDFYFAAATDTLDAFLSAQLSYDRYEFVVDVHRDMILKYAYAAFRNDLRVPGPAYFPRDPVGGVNRKTRTIFQSMFTRVFLPLSGDVLHSVEWRGSKLSEEYTRSVTVEESDGAAQGHPWSLQDISVPMLFSTNWERYYDFCRITGKNIPAWEWVCTTVLGRIGWDAWVLFQQGARMIKKTIIWLSR